MPFSVIFNLDLLFVGVVTSLIILLGFLAYLSDKRNQTNRAFFFLSISIFFWSIFNYWSYHVTNETFGIWLVRLTLLSAVYFAFFFLKFSTVFPKKEKTTKSISDSFIFSVVAFVVSILTLTPFLVSKVDVIENQVIGVSMSWGLTPFAIVILFFLIWSMFTILKKIRISNGQEKKLMKLIGAGVGITFFLLIFFNFILPAFWNVSFFVPFGPFFVLPFTILASYTILKHKFFNIKVTGIALLVFALSIVTFGEVIFADNLSIIIYRSSIFVLVLIIGISLIKGVLREVSLREQLQEANVQQERLIHFITHQVKGFFTVSRNIFAEILGGDYGPLSPQIKPLIEKGLSSDTDGVRMVQDVLNAANMKTGKLRYDMKPFDLKLLVEKIAASHRKEAVTKNLDYQVELGQSNPPAGGFQINGDQMQLEHALGNLIDNAIKYTPSGIVKISLKRENEKVIYSVKDSGIGITPEDMQNIFTEGGRGKNAKKVNVQSTGYGLYIAKQIVEAHNGQISVKSEGEGKGTIFRVELPVN